MKKVYITLIMAIIAVSAVAQNRPLQERGFMGANPAQLVPQLTVEQQESINILQLELRKELLQINNQLAEKRIQLISLQQVEKPSTKSINSKIDEITTIYNKKMKMIAQNRIKVRELLTEEQRVQFDLRMGSGRRGSNRGNLNYHIGTMNNRENPNFNRGTMNNRGVSNFRGNMGNRAIID